MRQHPAYLSFNSGNGAILARGALDGQLNEVIEMLKIITKFIDQANNLDEEKKKKLKILIARMTVGTSYELIVSFIDEDYQRRIKQQRERIEQLRINNPLFSFLYHCRNAAFHDGKFNFKNFLNDENPQWKNYQIEAKDYGKFLFEDKLKVEELPLLLHDVIDANLI